MSKQIHFLRQKKLIHNLAVSVMQNNSNIIQQPLQSLINCLNFFLNPNHFLIREKKNAINLDTNFDLRSPPNLIIVGRKIIYLFRTLFLIVIDHLAVVISWILMQKLDNLFIEKSWISEVKYLSNETFLYSLLIVNIFIFLASGLYSIKDRSRRLRDVISASFLSYSAFFCLLLVFWQVNDDRSILALILGVTWLVNLLIVCSERFLLFQTIENIRNNYLTLRRKILLVGTTEDIEECQLLFAENKVFDIVSTLDLSECDRDNHFRKIYQQVLLNNLDEVFICSWKKLPHQTKLFWNLQTSGISWRILPIKHPIPQQDPELANVEGIPTIRYTCSTIIGINFLWKRIFDLVVASLLLIILALPILAIGILIKLDSPGEIFYKQTRVGLKGKHFQVWKFRTMVANASQLQKKLEAKNQVAGGILFKIVDDPRITFIGKYLRRYSLDELPQLFNVLRGEMSLVGPRPLPIRDVAKFAEHHHFRHEVLPGITGLWQVSGRSDTDSDRVFNLDFQYIQNWSLALDIKILLKTVEVVLFSKGAY
jgi:exopolysaccharide biosynthesis polyprenyl glycosylphosphotransferase